MMSISKMEITHAVIAVPFNVFENIIFIYCTYHYNFFFYVFTFSNENIDRYIIYFTF